MGRYGTRGLGSVYRYRDGWAGQIVLTRPDGTRRRVTRYGKTQRDVQHKLDLLRRGEAAQAPDRLTVGAYLEQWLTVTLPQQVAAGRMSAATVESYTDNARLHIIPTLGRHPLAKLSAPMVRAWLHAKAGESSARGRPFAPRTLTYWHAILRAALADAVRDELLTRNVALLVEPPAGEKSDVQPLTTDEARRVLAAAIADRLRLLWLVMLALGLRRGEALALRWDAVDFDAATVTVGPSLQRRRTGEVTSGRNRTALATVKGKTRASAATLPLPGVLADALAAHRVTQRQERMASPVWADPGLVFTTSVGTALEPRNVNRSWAALCHRAGLTRPVRPHDLRHTAASLLLAEGASMKVIQETLRHSRMATTADVYTHVLAELSRDGADRMDRALRRLGE